MKKETQPRLCKLYTIRIKCLWPILTSTHGAQIEIFKYCFSLKVGSQRVGHNLVIEQQQQQQTFM